MKLGLIRHGETVFNREERMQGVRDIELSDLGRQQAIELGRLLRQEECAPPQLYSSPVKRALDTATLLGVTTNIIAHPGFRARSLGSLEGLTKSEIREKFPGAFERLVEWDYLPPGANETLRDIYTRANTAVEELVQRESEADQELVIVVTHSGVLEALLRGWMQISAGQKLPVPLKNAGVFWLERPESGSSWVFTGSLAVGEQGTLDLA
ncbi:MAG TPA: histidine phosphatase family protein [Candidatus Ozemobacteraceae bacterium]|nr:histidine phosphatase family protein [Candidatus Ozemobacteraceae bacterium]